MHSVSSRYLRLLVVVSAAFVATPLATIAEQAATEVEAAGFALSTDQDTLSLKATNAPLKAILEQIGVELHIQVDAQVADDETVTDEFQELSVDEALRRLAPNYAVITGKDDKKITKIVILPKGEATPEKPTAAEDVSAAGSQGLRKKDRTESEKPEPFKFEFDPSAVMTTK
jgi:hypothetical protein